MEAIIRPNGIENIFGMFVDLGGVVGQFGNFVSLQMPTCGARTRACRVHTRVNALNVVSPYSALCSHDCEHGTHESVRHVGTCRLAYYTTAETF